MKTQVISNADKKTSLQIHGANVEEVARMNHCSPEKIIDFSSSLNPLGPPETARQAILENINDISNYPQSNDDVDDLLADYLQINKNNLWLDNGSAALIYKIFDWLDFSKIAIVGPTFCEYESAALANDIDVLNIDLFSDQRAFESSFNRFNLHRQLESFETENIDAVFICNPNNPTTTHLPRSTIKWLAKKTRDNNTFLIVDEAFMDFVTDKNETSAKPLIDEFENLLVLGSLTKFFAIAGLRAGYICANEKLISEFSRKSPPWPINTLTSKAVIAALKDVSYITKTIAQLPVLRKDLIDNLEPIKGLRVYDSCVNFVFAEIKANATSSDLYEYLAKRKILIRDCASFKKLGQKFIRLAVKTPVEHRLLAKHVKAAINELS